MAEQTISQEVLISATTDDDANINISQEVMVNATTDDNATQLISQIVMFVNQPRLRTGDMFSPMTSF